MQMPGNMQNVITHRSWARPLGLSVRRSFEDVISREDTLSLVDMGLLKAFERFDPRRQTPFRAFARPWVRGAVHRAIAQELKHRSYVRQLSAVPRAESDCSLEDRIALRRHLRHLTENEQTLLLEYMALGLSIRQIAAQRGRSPSAIYRALQRYLEQIRQQISRDSNPSSSGAFNADYR